MERRLAAVLAADVAGYSTLMAANETQTLARLKALLRDIIKPRIQQFSGRLVKLMGDGLLVEFASTVNAVSCAVEIQNALLEHEQPYPESERICLRVGINLGDIIIDGEDIFGDGVNVAARLEGLAEPGGICISGTAFDTIDGKLEHQFADIGPQYVKNMDKPIRAYSLDRGPVGSTVEVKSMGDGPAVAKPSIAVLPFVNSSGDAEQEYFADGISEDIIARLGRCNWLRVLARNSTFAYKGRSVDTRRVATELGARYVLEGSIRQSGKRLRVTTQLLDGRDGTRLWGEQYDRTLADIFELQDEITSVIAGTLEPELEMREGARLTNQPPANLGAWECYQRALWHLYRFEIDALSQSRELLERAIHLDPQFARAYARLAYVYIQFGWYGSQDTRAQSIELARKIATHSVELDAQDPAGHLSLGRALTLCGQPMRGIDELKTAVELDPSFAQAHFALAQAYCYIDQHENAFPAINEAIRLSPRDPHLWTFLHVRGLANYQAGEFECAEADERKALRQPNVTHWPLLILIAVFGHSNRFSEASEAISDLHRMRPGFAVSDCRKELTFGEHLINTAQFVNRLAADLRSAGLPE